MSGATINLIGSEYSSTTSDNGNFMLESVLVINENYELRVFKNEYQGFLDNYFDYFDSGNNHLLLNNFQFHHLILN